MSSSKALRERRLLVAPPIMGRNFSNSFVLPVANPSAAIGQRLEILEWIADSTTGEFFLGAQHLYFMEDIDATAFILCDMQRKIDENEL